MDWSVESGSCWRAVVVAKAPAWVVLMVPGTRPMRFAAAFCVVLIVPGTRPRRFATPFRAAFADPDTRRTRLVT